MTTTDLASALADRAAGLQRRLLDKVAANLSGEILQTRSGTLKASIVADLASGGDGVIASVASTGVPYAAIQERGGTTSPQTIVPVKARALAFAARVHHPGSAIQARAPLGGALDALRDEIAFGLKEAVRSSLGLGP